ncbi:hypothetical protein GCM10027449_18940 [Sinomonas notoginsengisoli]|uniref:hypothetical protein n=1 Tax=Sinomonas notoginsengisoli TaxID=1457311 RepID=UPI001F1E129B|nr:hypothetical protein [Sinomonas notoginsengisoli]
MSPEPTPPPYQEQPYQPNQPDRPAYAPLPPQGAYQGPWPSQMPSGTFPGMSPVGGIPRPTTITLAFWMLIAAAVLPLATIPAVLDWMRLYIQEAAREAITASGRRTAGAFAEQFVTVSAPIVWISSIATVAIAVLLALGIRAGMGWVRILLTVMTGLSLVGYLMNAVILTAISVPTAVLFPFPVFVYVTSAAAALLYLAAAVLMWLRPSSRYFAARRAAKLGGGYLR